MACLLTILHAVDPSSYIYPVERSTRRKKTRAAIASTACCAQCIPRSRPMRPGGGQRWSQVITPERIHRGPSRCLTPPILGSRGHRESAFSILNYLMERPRRNDGLQTRPPVVHRETYPREARRSGPLVRSGSGTTAWNTHLDGEYSYIPPPFGYPAVSASCGNMDYRQWRALRENETRPGAIDSGAGFDFIDQSEQDIVPQAHCIAPNLLALDTINTSHDGKLSQQMGNLSLIQTSRPTCPTSLDVGVSHGRTSTNETAVPITSPTVIVLSTNGERAPCRYGSGDGCGLSVDLSSISGLKVHLYERHLQEMLFYTSVDGKSMVSCTWVSGEKICGQAVARDRITKHVAVVHLRMTMQQCTYCGAFITRGDALLRHLRRGDCKRIPDDERERLRQVYKARKRRRGTNT
ncbi:uncharacterized protein C8Q71DRAFT_353436 [Rhodofomes roseus]|uniref:C2H2-type domain-containing protein n=1 Tax=Rhodofomes roseus TaxID=34475 RepID=A0ABQ8KT66_9APHY|nr:uncharacterized protein C8Q71DRAFT_353436 [Rhodofomes roseus]KAH9841907.1 hypothetical protein C8Q71DRAFT_353436 [Rhodofomes roseus]